MRILHVLGKLDRGGVETWLVQVLRHIDRQKYQMDFLVHDPTPGAYDEEVRSLGARIIPCLGYRNPARYALNFWRILREYGPYDCVHSHVHNYSGYVLLLAKIAGVPMRIAHSHSDTRRVEPSVGPMRKAYRGAMQRLIRGCASGGLAVSTEAGHDLFPPHWRESSTWALQHLGIDLSRFELAVDRDTVRQELGIPKQAIVVGHIGRFTAEKNHMFLVEIAREVIRLEPRAFLLLVGDGPLRPAVEAMVARYSLQHRFAFTGVRPDIPALMIGAMDAFVFPSLHEGLPITLLEAQAAGLKCVISDVISMEADLVPNLVVRESVRDSATQWAWQLLEQLSSSPRMPFNVTSEHLAARSITASIERLSSFYAAFSRA